MKIHEYQAKKFFSDYAIPVERHILCNTAQEVTAAFSQLGNEKVAIKAQVLTGGRGKAGGVKLAGNAEEALQHAEAILGMTIKDFPVTRVIVSEAVNIHLEYYVSFVIDRNSRSVVLMMSAEGGSGSPESRKDISFPDRPAYRDSGLSGTPLCLYLVR